MVETVSLHTFASFVSASYISLIFVIGQVPSFRIIPSVYVQELVVSLPFQVYQGGFCSVVWFCLVSTLVLDSVREFVPVTSNYDSLTGFNLPQYFSDGCPCLY